MMMPYTGPPMTAEQRRRTNEYMMGPANRLQPGMKRLDSSIIPPWKQPDWGNIGPPMPTRGQPTPLTPGQRQAQILDWMSPEKAAEFRRRNLEVGLPTRGQPQPQTSIPGGQQQVLAPPPATTTAQPQPWTNQNIGPGHPLWDPPAPAGPTQTPAQPLSIPQQWTQNYDPRTQPGGVFPAPEGGIDQTGRINRRPAPSTQGPGYSITSPSRPSGGGPAPTPANMQGGVPGGQRYKAPGQAPPSKQAMAEKYQYPSMQEFSGLSDEAYKNLSTGGRAELRRKWYASMDVFYDQDVQAWRRETQQAPQTYGPGGTPLPGGGGTPSRTGSGAGSPATGGGALPGQGSTGYPQGQNTGLSNAVQNLLAGASPGQLQDTPAQREQESRLTPAQEKIMGTTAGTYEPLIGISPQAPVGPTADQQQITGPILQNLLSQMYGQQGLASQAGQALQPGLSGQSAYGMTPGAAENWYQQSVENPIMQEGGTWDKLLASVQEGHAGPGYFSRSTQKDKLAAASQTQQYLAGEKAKYGWMGEQMGFEGAESAAGRQLSAAQAAAATPQKIWQGLASSYGLATLPQQQQQAIQDTLNQITDPQVLSVISMLLGVPAVQGVTIPGVEGLAKSAGTLAMAGGGGLLESLFGGGYYG